MPDAHDIPNFLDRRGLESHQLANLFPLIEGVEFDELVTSIKENGQHDTIVLLDGKILDGRNRYRACIKAGVEPRMTEFTGTDPVRFVMDHNIHRRHLNESQRAIIAAKLLSALEISTTVPAHDESGRFTKKAELTVSDAAKLLNVDPHTVFSAKKVLAEATVNEVQAVERGDAAVSTIAKQLRQKMPRAYRAREQGKSQSERGKNPDRIATQRLHGQMWSQLRDALNNLTSLPIPQDVVSIARSHDRNGFVDARLTQSIEWLKEFADVWNKQDRNAA